MSLLLPVVADDSLSMEIISLAALSLGFIFVGSGNGEVASTILQAMMERDDKALDEKWGRFLSLGLALLYLGSYPQLPLPPCGHSFEHALLQVNLRHQMLPSSP